MISQTEECNNAYVSELKKITYTGPIKVDGKPDKRSKEWKAYIKKKMNSTQN